ncbi:MAG: hypothetical protein KBT48_03470 [Firmicutes bacterium]|nr:hypothetical protein [Bacillota bacterium]
MKRFLRVGLGFILSLSMIAQFVQPIFILAQENTADESSEAVQDQTQKEIIEKNEDLENSGDEIVSDEYEIVEVEEELSEEESSLPDSFYTNIDDAGEEMLRQMMNQEEVKLYYIGEMSEEVVVSIYERAITHNGNGKAGDYIRAQTGNWEASVCSYGDDKYLITYSIQYYNTLEQEELVSSKIKQVLEELNLATLSDYDKIKTIYDYIAESVKYDYAGLNDESDLVKYTAYGALIDKSAVCQGYASLLYRMLLSQGIDCRIIRSESLNHSWNIVELDGIYYYLDVTWDSNYYESNGEMDYSYFLMGVNDFENHECSDSQFYQESGFKDRYPLAVSKYVSKQDVDESIWTSHAADSYSNGEGTKESPYIISTAEQLALLALSINNQSEMNSYYELDADIDLEGHDWVPIGSATLYKGNVVSDTNAFNGHFDGKGHSICNMTISKVYEDEDYYGLFGLIYGGDVKNITLKNSNIQIHNENPGWDYGNGMSESLEIGTVVGYVTQGNVQNIHVLNTNIQVDSQMGLIIGGVVGDINYGTMSKITASGNINAYTTKALFLGGTIGIISNETSVNDCNSNFQIASNREGKIQNSIYDYELSYVDAIGGFAGMLGRANYNVEVKNCSVSGSITATDDVQDPSGGMFAGGSGNIYGNSIFENLTSDVEVSNNGITQHYFSVLEGYYYYPNKYSADYTYHKNLVTVYDGMGVIYSFLDGEEKLFTVQINKSYTKSDLLQDLIEEKEIQDTDSHILVEAFREAPTCEENGRIVLQCRKSGCGHQEYQELPAYGHKEVTVKGQAATCLEDGKTDGIKCKRCQKEFVPQEKIEALGHDVVIDNYIAATFTSEGKTEGKHCARCNEVFVEQEIIPKLKEEVLKGYSLSISGDIGVNFYMQVAQENGYMEFKYPNGNYENIPIEDALSQVIDGVEYKIFTCKVSSKSMAENIYAQMHYSNDVTGEEYVYSVEEYANYLFEHESEYSERDISIAKTMLTYGKYSQDYFDYKVENEPKDINVLQDVDFNSYAYQLNDQNDSIDFIGARLILTSKPGLKLYFTGNITSNEYTVSKEGNYTVVTITNIDDMSKMYEINDNNFSLKYSIFSYGKQAMNTSNTSLKNLMNAMYAYDQALKN